VSTPDSNDPNDFIRHFKAAAAFLSSREEEINRLNVFPVPDGDTGINMSLTIASVVRELDDLGEDTSAEKIRKAVTHGSLMGARGNSGVITSQILRGFCDGVADTTEFDPGAIAEGFRQAKKVAFSAVRKPVEGTILTVLSDISEAATKLAREGCSLELMFVELAEAAMASVRRTPELLPVLKENGVVDAGGYGLALLVQGFVSSFTARPISKTSDIVSGQKEAQYRPKVAIEQINDWEGSDYLYCTEFLLTSESIELQAARDFLSKLGDCEILVGSHPDFKVHVHTNNPGSVLSYMTERGQVAEVHIHNMRLQSAERQKRLAADDDDAAVQLLPLAVAGQADGLMSASASSSGAALSAAAQFGGIRATEGNAEHKLRGYVAVASGIGLFKILASLGVDVVVSGGQTMNPSTAELLEAIDMANADEVIVFPNNKNIIMCAQAAAKMATKKAAVVATKSVPENFTALFASLPEQPMEEEVDKMCQAVAGVRTAEVTTAVKAAKSRHGADIQAGDIIGILDDDVEVVGSDLQAVALELLAMMLKGDYDTLTMLAGKDYGQGQFEDLIAKVNERFPDVEVDAHRGEQPLYPLVMAVE